MNTDPQTAGPDSETHKDPKTAPSPPTPTGSYLRTIAEIPRAVSSLLWSLAGLIVALTVGQISLSSRSQPPHIIPRVQTIRISSPRKALLDQAVRDSLQKARDQALAYGDAQLTAWSSKVMIRVDPFLDWYFGYCQQQSLSARALWYAACHWLDPGQPTDTERLRRDLQTLIASQVLRPEIAQRELSRITEDSVNLYVDQVRIHLSSIPSQVPITDPDWDNYLDEISALCARVEGGRSTPLTLKALLTSTTAGMVFLAKPLKELTVRAAAQVVPRLAVRLATRAGGAVEVRAVGVAGVGGKFVGPLVTIGVIVWDVYDHRSTVARERPILKQSIADYLTTVREDLLKGPHGLSSTLSNLEADLVPKTTTRGPNRAPRP